MPAAGHPIRPACNLDKLHQSAHPKDASTKSAMKNILLAMILSISAVQARAEFIISPPSNHPITKAINRLSTMIDTNGPVFVSIQPCGTVNAQWDRQATITICTELLNQAESRAADAVRNGIPRETAFASAAGQSLFVFLHETAHALIQRHQLPFTGRNEDAADQFAAWMLIQMNPEQLYIGATNSLAERKQFIGQFRSNSSMSDEHGLTLQRRVQLVCWGYGKDPQTFARLAAHIDMTQHRLMRCKSEYDDLMSNTPRVFSPALKM